MIFFNGWLPSLPIEMQKREETLEKNSEKIK